MEVSMFSTELFRCSSITNHQLNLVVQINKYTPVPFAVANTIHTNTKSEGGPNASGAQTANDKSSSSIDQNGIQTR